MASDIRGTMPCCQTTAGCICYQRFVYTPAPANDGCGTVIVNTAMMEAEIRRLQIENARLSRELGEATVAVQWAREAGRGDAADFMKQRAKEVRQHLSGFHRLTAEAIARVFEEEAKSIRSLQPAEVLPDPERFAAASSLPPPEGEER